MGWHPTFEVTSPPHLRNSGSAIHFQMCGKTILHAVKYFFFTVESVTAACNLSPGCFDSRLATAGYAYGGEATALRMVTDYL